MADDVTGFVVKTPATTPKESTIFNTSIRGWIALALALGLTISMVCMMLAYCFSVKIPPEVAATVMTLFTSAVSASITHYFQQHSREGQKP